MPSAARSADASELAVFYSKMVLKRGTDRAVPTRSRSSLRSSSTTSGPAGLSGSAPDRVACHSSKNALLAGDASWRRRFPSYLEAETSDPLQTSNRGAVTQKIFPYTIFAKRRIWPGTLSESPQILCTQCHLVGNDTAGMMNLRDANGLGSRS